MILETGGKQPGPAIRIEPVGSQAVSWGIGH